jgi:hypothetical protein
MKNIHLYVWNKRELSVCDKSVSKKAHNIHILILIVNYSDLLIGLIAASWLQSFGQNICVVSTVGNQTHNLELLKQSEYQTLNILRKLKLTLPIIEDKSSESFFKEKQDYTLTISSKKHTTLNTTLFFPGIHFNFNPTNWIPTEMQLKDQLTDNNSLFTIEKINSSDLASISKEIHKCMFDFYLKELCGKEMLGSDSCGVSCDL